jgi:DNA-binding NarL/FixJ family response regulator
MANIRVLILDVPNILRDILAQVISSEVDMELIPAPVAPQAAGGPPLAPDVVIAGASESEPGDAARALLARWPHSHMLMIAARGHQVLSCDMYLRITELGEVSPDQFVQAIRSAVRSESHPHLA